MVNSFVSSEIAVDSATGQWTVEYTLAKFKTLTETFTLGKDYQASKPLGETMTGRSLIEGGKLVSRFKQQNGAELIQTREVTPDGQLLWVLVVPETDVTFKRWMNRA